MKLYIPVRNTTAPILIGVISILGLPGIIFLFINHSITLKAHEMDKVRRYKELEENPVVLTHEQCNIELMARGYAKEKLHKLSQEFRERVCNPIKQPLHFEQYRAPKR